MTQTQLKASTLFHTHNSMILFIPKTAIFFNTPIQATKTAAYPIPSTNSKENHPTTPNYIILKVKTCNYNPIIINLQ